MPDEKRERSKEFRFFFVNAFNVKYSDNDVALTLSNQHVFSGESNPTYVEEAVVMMTPRSVKLLARVLEQITRDMEEKFGPLELGPEKEELLSNLETQAATNQTR